MAQPVNQTIGGTALMTLSAARENPMSTTSSIPTRYFEDFQPGMVFEFGAYEVGETEIISFGKAFDPQPYHTSPQPPQSSGSGRLIASGWHTAAITMRMLVDHFIPPVTILPSPGHEALKWPRPVYPSDRLRVRATVLGARASESKPDRGIVQLRIETLNQHDEVVQEMMSPTFFRRRSIPMRRNSPVGVQISQS
jgi:acyl dehydratase